MAKAGRGSDQFMVRLPEGIRDKIAVAAEANGRSMNAEIVARIEEYPELKEYKQSFQQAEAVNTALSAERQNLLLKLTELKAELLTSQQLVANYKRTLDEYQDKLEEERRINADWLQLGRRPKRISKKEPLTEDEKNEIWAWLEANIKPKG